MLVVATVLLAVVVAAATAIGGVLRRGEETVRAALEKSQAASATKSSFLGLVSHELRTPLTSLQLQIERLKRDREASLTPRQAEVVSRMSGTCRRLADMVSALLQYVRIESGGLKLALSPVQMAPVVEEALDEMRLVAQHKGLTLVCEPPPEMPHLVTDPQLLRFVVTNLVGNAIKFTQEGTIEVALAHGAEGHVLTVKDTGPGIAPEEQARVFEPFEQLEPIREKHVHGIGLGLALVREITLALGGTVELSSAPGAGSTFRVVLPPPAARQKVA
jgi:signal transduction histidine kinase